MRRALASTPGSRLAGSTNRLPTDSATRASSTTPTNTRTNFTAFHATRAQKTAGAERCNLPARFSLAPCWGDSGSLRPEVLQDFVHAIHRIIGAFLHSRRHHSVAIGDRLEDQLLNEPGLLPKGFEVHGLQQHVARHALELEGRHDPLGRDDVVVNTVEGELVSVLVALDEPPQAAGPCLHLVDGGRVLSRAKPL